MTDEQRTTVCCYDLAMIFWEILNKPIVLFFHLFSGCLVKFESKSTITKILNQWFFNVTRNNILNVVVHCCFFLRKRSCDFRIWKNFLLYQWVLLDTSEWVVNFQSLQNFCFYNFILLWICYFLIFTDWHSTSIINKCSLICFVSTCM